MFVFFLVSLNHAQSHLVVEANRWFQICVRQLCCIKTHPRVQVSDGQKPFFFFNVRASTRVRVWNKRKLCHFCELQNNHSIWTVVFEGCPSYCDSRQEGLEAQIKAMKKPSDKVCLGLLVNCFTNYVGCDRTKVLEPTSQHGVKLCFFVGVWYDL